MGGGEAVEALTIATQLHVSYGDSVGNHLHCCKVVRRMGGNEKREEASQDIRRETSKEIVSVGHEEVFP